MGLRPDWSSDEGEGEGCFGAAEEGVKGEVEVVDDEAEVVGRRCVVCSAVDEGVHGISRSGRLEVSSSSEGPSKALKTEGLLSSKKVCEAAGAVLKRCDEREGRPWMGNVVVSWWSLGSSREGNPYSMASSNFEVEASQTRSLSRASGSW